MQSERITEVKDALLAAIDAIKKTSHVLKMASEQYYFPDKEVVLWCVTHDACVAMQNMAISLENCARAFHEVFGGLVGVPSDLGPDWCWSEDSDDYCDPRFNDPNDMDTDNEC
jgi:hypothetical protein